MSFRFRAAAADGRMETGVLAAESVARAVAELRQRGLVPVEVEPVEGRPAASRATTFRAWRGRTSRDEAVALWCRTVGTLASAGVPLDQALTFAHSQGEHAALRTVMERVTDDVRAGVAVGEALRRHPTYFPEVIIALIDAGAHTGALDEALLRAAAWLDEVQGWRAQLRAALVYPVLIAVVTMLATIVLLTVVVPRFAVILQDAGGDLPASTRLLLAISGFLGTTWWWWLGLVMVGGAAVRVWGRTPEARVWWHGWRLRLPVIGELDEAIGTARYVRTLGQLLQGGMPLLGAMRLAGTAVPNAAMARTLQQAELGVREGRRLAAVLESALSPLARQLLTAGEESGQLPAMCLRIAESSEDTVRRTVRTLVALVEPAVIVLFGVIVGFVALAMLQALYGLQSTSWGRGFS